MRILAIDFETADVTRDSACAVGAVLVENGRVVESFHRLIRPPQSYVLFTAIHGIRWEDVADQPRFNEIWPDLAPLVAAADLFAAHNAGFDRSVMFGCCAAYGIKAPTQRWLCTVKLSRTLWNIFPTKLPNVCDHFGIPLDHHDALSDASACAEIARRAVIGGNVLECGILGDRRLVAA
ncbi:3'-5' exonuclease [Sphingoaurantiacus capsulatus]|uniref:3'-5' exonuclease n=1 Tax=Sphingoaurantiacus capsulatus TaxID=1771310 RepID=A0ABV7XA41_9SPHN